MSVRAAEIAARRQYGGGVAHIRYKLQKPAKNYVWKIREIDGSYLCLQQFDKFWIWCAWNDWKRKLSYYSETCMKKFVKSLQVNLFLAGFSRLKPLCAAARAAPPFHDKNQFLEFKVYYNKIPSTLPGFSFIWVIKFLIVTKFHWCIEDKTGIKIYFFLNIYKAKIKSKLEFS